MLVLAAVLGCAKEQPRPEDSPMSQNGVSATAAEDSTEQRLNLLELAAAVPTDQMPKFLQERMQQSPPTVSLDEVRKLDESTRSHVLAIVERAVTNYQEDARRHRARTNPAQRTADQLQAFLDAARK
jgi:hypothetical protein